MKQILISGRSKINTKTLAMMMGGASEGDNDPTLILLLLIYTVCVYVPHNSHSRSHGMSVKKFRREDF